MSSEKPETEEEILRDIVVDLMEKRWWVDITESKLREMVSQATSFAQRIAGIEDEAVRKVVIKLCKKVWYEDHEPELLDARFVRLEDCAVEIVVATTMAELSKA